jgi:hypothetical protein
LLNVYEFIARRHDCNGWSAGNDERCLSGDGCNADVRGREAKRGLEKDVPLGAVDASRVDVAAGLNGVEAEADGGGAIGLFMFDDGVARKRHCGSGCDGNARVRWHDLRRGGSSGKITYDPKCRAVRALVGVHGVTVHRGAVERGMVAVGVDRLKQDTTARVFKVDRNGVRLQRS